MHALRKIMQPVVRLLLRNNVTLQAFIDFMKECYVTVAEETLVQEKQKPTDSHISIMTGVHRKDVKSIREKNADTAESMPKSFGVIAELIARWGGNSLYSDEQGPKSLCYSSKTEGAASFVTLAESVSKDIRPRALLEELTRLGYAEFDAVEDMVTLKTESFVPRENWSEKLHYFGRNTGDHISAAAVNIMSQSPPFLDRAVYHDGLTKDSVAKLRKIAVDNAMKALKAVNRKAFELSENDKNSQEEKYRINLGTYFFSDMFDQSEDK